MTWMLLVYLCNATGCTDVKPTRNISPEMCREVRTEIMQLLGKPDKHGKWAEARCFPELPSS